MPQLLRTTLLQDVALTAGGNIRVDLPVNPLSFIALTVRALNNTPTGQNFSHWADLLSFLNRITVQYRGASIIAGTGVDLALFAAAIAHWVPRQGQGNAIDNNVRFLTFPLLFGRKPYSPLEAFPATRRGDLTLQIDAGAALPLGLDTFTIQAETLECLDAQPTSFLKVTETRRTMQLGDQNEISLPLGNRLLGLLLRAATAPSLLAFDSSFGSIALELDNVEIVYSRSNWETLSGELYRRIGSVWPYRDHSHRINGSGAAAAAYAQATAMGIAADANNTSITTGTAARFGITGIQFPTEDDAELQRYAYADLDPLEDGSYAIDTANAADFNLLVTSDVADAQPSRILIAEHVQLGAGGAAPA